MRLVVQNAADLRLTADGEDRGSVDKGLFVLVGVKKGDTPDIARAMADRLSKLRVIPDAKGRLNLSVTDPDACADLAVVSNFTLYADCAASRRPDFFQSASFDEGKKLYDAFLAYLGLALKDRAAEGGRAVKTVTGVFGADMEIGFRAVGPVTVILDSDQPGMVR